MKKLGLLVLLTGFVIVSAQENYAQWGYSRNITVNTTSTGANVPATQIKFPLLVRLTPGNFDFSKASSNGSDIRFTKANGTTRLKHHIERWDFAGQAAEIWVLADTVFGNGSTAFKMFFGKSGAADSSNSAAVFDTLNNFSAVFHLGEAMGDTARDVTAHQYKGVPKNHGGSNPVDVTGAIGRAKNFLGNNSDNNGGSYQIVTSTGGNTFNSHPLNFHNDSSTFQGLPLYTLSAWVYVSQFPDAAGNQKAIVAKGSGSILTTQYCLRLQNPAINQLTTPIGDTMRVQFTDPIPALYKSGINNLGSGTWYHVAAVRSGVRGVLGNTRVWVNGYAPPVTDPGISSNSSTPTFVVNANAYIGSLSNDSGYFNGNIDEVEFSGISRDSNWLKLDYETQKPNATCVASGALQQQFPSNLVYSANPATYAKGTAIPANIPTYVGIATHFSVAPPLPGGLSLDTNTGVITGTPVAIQPAGNYSITASSIAGSATTPLSIRVLTPPSALFYPANPVIYGVHVAIANNVPTVSGDVTRYSVSPALPTGLALDTSTGVISGVSTVVTPATNYAVTASNPASSTTTAVNITVLSPPSGLSYTVNNALYGVGLQVANNVPSVTGIVENYSVGPALPPGMVMDPVTGVISGIPAVVTPATNYTVTAANIAGITPAVLNIATMLVPSNLTYVTNSPEYAATMPIHPDTPSVTGLISRYSVSPSLPTGLSFDTVTGVISGIPTLETPTTSCIVTASNPVGFTRDTLRITVTTAPPSNLHYSANTAVYGVGIPIANNIASVAGTTTHFTVSPALPTGMTLDLPTGMISGTPTVASPATKYVVTAGNLVGSTVDTVTFTVLAAPSNLSYSGNPAVYGVNVSITNNDPSVTGTVTGYSVTPALPAGLTLDFASGVITGMPTVVQPAANYSIKAFNGPAFTTFSLSIAVLSPPAGLTYPTIPDTATFGIGVSIGSRIPSVNGTVTRYSIPSLPAGLVLDSVTGVLSGTPMAASAPADYTIIAGNVAGTSSRTLRIAVLAPPLNLSYAAGIAVYGINAVIANNAPTVTGVVTTYSVSPPLPTGLVLNTVSGVISGNPTEASTATSYVVMASNVAGSTTATLTLSVLAPPSGLSYSENPAIYGVNVSVAGNLPSLGGVAGHYSVTPSLPPGLSLDTVTGVISGTPTAAHVAASYTVTVNNVAGSTTSILNIRVLAVPANLSYSDEQSTVVLGINSSVNVPSVTGLNLRFSSSPALPPGLSLDSLSGMISGIPTTGQSFAKDYVITARNIAGSVQAVVNIAVVGAPANLSYFDPTPTYANNLPITSPDVPAVQGIVTQYSVAPALPSGIYLDATTGYILGTPTLLSATASYVITAQNPGGSAQTTIFLGVALPP